MVSLGPEEVISAAQKGSPSPWNISCQNRVENNTLVWPRVRGKISTYNSDAAFLQEFALLIRKGVGSVVKFEL